MNNRLRDAVLHVIRCYGTRDPFEILDAMGVTVRYSQAFQKDGLKGFCGCFNRIYYVVINVKLCREEQRVIAAHELAHLVLHADKLKMGAFQDNDVYNPTSSWEREANFFAADLLCTDDEVIDQIKTEDADFFRVARFLSIPAPFFAFKLYNMIERGFPLRLPVDLDSTFLAK